MVKKFREELERERQRWRHEFDQEKQADLLALREQLAREQCRQHHSDKVRGTESAAPDPKDIISKRRHSQRWEVSMGNKCWSWTDILAVVHQKMGAAHDWNYRQQLHGASGYGEREGMGRRAEGGGTLGGGVR